MNVYSPPTNIKQRKLILPKLIKYYHVSEVNGKTLPAKIEFKPKGMAKFHADLEYKFDSIKMQFKFETDHRIPRTKFASWSQQHLYRIEHLFHKRVVALRLEALLSGNTQEYERLMSIPTEGSFTAYVEE